MNFHKNRLDSSNLGSRLFDFSPFSQSWGRKAASYLRTPARAEFSPAHNSPAAAYPVAGLFSHFMGSRHTFAYPINPKTTPHGRFVRFFGCVLSTAPQFRLCCDPLKLEVTI